MEWLRWYHGACSDSKWQVIARRSGSNVGTVVAVWAALLEHASQDEERGSVDGFDPETFDAHYGFADGVCAAVMSAMMDKGMIAEGCIASWAKRQTKDESATERKRLQREREKIAQERAELEKLRCEIDKLKQDNTKDVTVCHAMSQGVTKSHLEQRREEKRREEDHISPSNTENEDPARAIGTSKERDGNSLSPEEAGIEFVELRDMYDRLAKAEAPLAGFPEYKQLRASRTWPGMSSITDAIDRLSREDAQWRDGFAPGLARFLREHTWRKQPTARASPDQPDISGAAERMAQLAKSTNIIRIPG